MHLSKKGNQWHFGMKVHITVNADSGLVHTVRGAAGHVADVTAGKSLLHGQETVVHADAGYRGADKRADARPDVQWQVAMRAGKRKKRGQGKQSHRRAHGQNREVQGEHPGQGLAPVSRGQAPVWLREGGLPGFEEKHAATQNAVCAVEPADGPAPIDGNAGMRVSKSRENCLE